jgi:DNA-binding CsgD family transcriptional regulator
LTKESALDLLVLAIDVNDPILAERMISLLADVPGLRLARAGEKADAVLMSSRPIDAPGEQVVAVTPREIEVLNLMAEGASNKTIARRLEISVHTVKFHVGSLLDKLDAAGRTDAVAHAARLRAIQL